MEDGQKANLKLEALKLAQAIRANNNHYGFAHLGEEAKKGAYSANDVAADAEKLVEFIMK